MAVREAHVACNVGGWRRSRLGGTHVNRLDSGVRDNAPSGRFAASSPPRGEPELLKELTMRDISVVLAYSLFCANAA